MKRYQLVCAVSMQTLGQPEHTISALLPRMRQIANGGGRVVMVDTRDNRCTSDLFAPLTWHSPAGAEYAVSVRPRIWEPETLADVARRIAWRRNCPTRAVCRGYTGTEDGKKPGERSHE